MYSTLNCKDLLVLPHPSKEIMSTHRTKLQNMRVSSALDSQWSEVNSLVSTLSKSSCPMKTIEKWFPKCKRQKKPKLNGAVTFERKRRKKISCHGKNIEKVSSGSPPLSTNVSGQMESNEYESTANPLFDPSTQISSSERDQFHRQWNKEIEGSAFDHKKQIHQPLQKALLVQTEVTFCSETPYNYLFHEVNHLDKESYYKNIPERATLSTQEMSKLVNFIS